MSRKYNFCTRTLKGEVKEVDLKETANFQKKRGKRVRKESMLTKMLKIDVLDKEETNNKFFLGK